jgi:autoinducer 2-degrading protein
MRPATGEANVFAIFVSVKIKPEKRDQFLAAIEDDSICSVRDEPGCVRFEVLQDKSDPDRYYFYEVYKDEAALEAHRQFPHYSRWSAASKECLAEPTSAIRTETVFPRNYA